MKCIVVGLLLLTLFTANHAIGQTTKEYKDIKERIKKGLNLDDAKTDSVAAILKRYFTVVKIIRENEGISDQNKQLKIKKEKKQQVARLKTFLTPDQLQKLRLMVQQYKDMRQQNNQQPVDTSISKYYF